MALDPTTKKAALFSGIIHLFSLLFLILAVVFSNLFARKEEPFIYEMVALPESLETIEAETIETIQDVTVDIPEMEPIELPEPEPEPPPEPEPVRQPEPKPEPVVRQPPPPKPEPVVRKPVERKPAPAPEEKPKPEIITIDQFIQEHGIPDRPIPERKPPPQPQRRQIDTSRIERNLRQITVSELSLTVASPTTDTDAMKTWRSLLAARLDALWKQSDIKGGSGKSVRVSFFISAGGAISSVKVVNSSGVSSLDSEGLNTVRRLGSFSPPPSGKGETITVLLKVE